MADIFSQRLLTYVKRIVATRGGLPTNNMLEDVMAVLPLVDVDQPENRFIRRERLWSLASNGPQITTTTFNSFVFTNPAGSGKLLIVKGVSAYGWVPLVAVQPNGAASEPPALYVSYPQAGVKGAGSFPFRIRDGRQLGPTAPFSSFYAIVSNAAIVTSGTLFGTASWFASLSQVGNGAAAALAIFNPSLDLVVPPGFYVETGMFPFAFPTTNWDSVFCSWWGYERDADDAELAPQAAG